MYKSKFIEKKSLIGYRKFHSPLNMYSQNIDRTISFFLSTYLNEQEHDSKMGQTWLLLNTEYWMWPKLGYILQGI